jgi:DNA-directed RNA polymerase subunit alpha
MSMDAKVWQGLIKPSKYRKHEGSSTSYGKFSWEPLETGFGITLGNALRRVLLSSIEGAAITGVRVDNIYHEFSTIPGVVEDFLNIILNLKQVRLRVYSEETQTMHLKATGPKVVRAGDIEVPHNVTIVNPEKEICTLDSDASLHMELTAARGRGYEQAKTTRDVEGPIGYIPIDAIYSPVTKVTFAVTPARVEHRTDYDRLTLEVWTDGTITPEEAVTISARILQDQLNVFVFPEIQRDVQTAHREALEAAPLKEVLLSKIEELDVSHRTINTLRSTNVYYIGELVQKSEEELLQAKNLGKKSVGELKEALARLGLTLGMQVDQEAFLEHLKTRLREGEYETQDRTSQAG